MATLTANGLTLAEAVKRHGPDGNMLKMTEVLMSNYENEILMDAPFRESNDFFSNVAVRRASEPSGTWRKINKGVGAEKSDSVQVRDTIGMLESWAFNDCKVIDSFKDPQRARSDEVLSFVNGLGKTMASTMIYGSTTTTPEKFTGLAPRLASLATTTNVLNEGGSGSDCTSVFVVNWGPDTVHMVYPRNSMAGLMHNNLGKDWTTDSDGNFFMAYIDHFVWEAGMVVKDPKSIGRLANIESAGASNTFDEDNLITLINRMNIGPGARIYANNTVLTQMEILFKDKTNVNFTKEDGLAPGPVLMFKKIPVRRVDKILNTEAALT